MGVVTVSKCSGADRTGCHIHFLHGGGSGKLERLLLSSPMHLGGKDMADTNGNMEITLLTKGNRTVMVQGITKKQLKRYKQKKWVKIATLEDDPSKRLVDTVESLVKSYQMA